jgi:hypothetical protein
MADNFPLTPGTGRNAATDEVTYSGDTSDVQLVRPVLVTGAEGSKTVVELTGDNANGLDVDVTRLPSLVAGTANIGDVDVLTMPAITGAVTANAGTDLNTSALALESGGNLAGAATSLALMDDWDNGAGDGASVSGDVAHGVTNAGEPIQVGMEAIDHGTNPAAVSAGQRTRNYANRAGIPFYIGGHPNVITLELAVTGSQTDVAVITAGSGVKIVVTQIQVVTDNANTAFPQIRVGFGTANTPTTTGVVLTHPGLPAGGGVSRGDGSGILGVGADGADLRVTCGAPTGGSLRILVSYYTIES